MKKTPLSWMLIAAAIFPATSLAAAAPFTFDLPANVTNCGRFGGAELSGRVDHLGLTLKNVGDGLVIDYTAPRAPGAPKPKAISISCKDKKAITQIKASSLTCTDGNLTVQIDAKDGSGDGFDLKVQVIKSDETVAVSANCSSDDQGSPQ